MNRKLLTLTLALRDDEILLGMKKRGFGAGRWNGFGGKVQDGETVESAAKRETTEECGITITGMEAVGIHEFEFEKERGMILEVHVFRITSFTGEPVETEEMQPKWFHGRRDTITTRCGRMTAIGYRFSWMEKNFEQSFFSVRVTRSWNRISGRSKACDYSASEHFSALPIH